MYGYDENRGKSLTYSPCKSALEIRRQYLPETTDYFTALCLLLNDVKTNDPIKDCICAFLQETADELHHGLTSKRAPLTCVQLAEPSCVTHSRRLLNSAGLFPSRKEHTLERYFTCIIEELLRYSLHFASWEY